MCVIKKAGFWWSLVRTQALITPALVQYSWCIQAIGSRICNQSPHSAPQPRLILKCLGLSEARCLCNSVFLFTSSLRSPWNFLEKAAPKKDDKMTNWWGLGHRRSRPEGEEAGIYLNFFTQFWTLTPSSKSVSPLYKCLSFCLRKIILVLFLHLLWGGDPKEQSFTLHWVSWDEIGLHLMLPAISGKAHRGFAGSQLQGRCDAWHGGSASRYLHLLPHET